MHLLVRKGNRLDSTLLRATDLLDVLERQVALSKLYPPKMKVLGRNRTNWNGGAVVGALLVDTISEFPRHLHVNVWPVEGVAEMERDTGEEHWPMEEQWRRVRMSYNSAEVNFLLIYCRKQAQYVFLSLWYSKRMYEHPKNVTRSSERSLEHSRTSQGAQGHTPVQYSPTTQQATTSAASQNGCSTPVSHATGTIPERPLKY